MTGQAHWFVPVAVLVGSAAICAPVLGLGRVGSFLMFERDRIFCPREGRIAHSKLIEDVRTGKYVEVRHRSGLSWRKCRRCCELLNAGVSMHPTLRPRSSDPRSLTSRPAAPWRA